ncbi:hypothetical protein AAF712_007980 [Marasmius tenuissimus]|uniref:Uncharacterized protein n=1 Tax=Marasmius tenuissimus TaxID=585030 RepID=A0ABR2ZW25_9AGAR
MTSDPLSRTPFQQALTAQLETQQEHIGRLLQELVQAACHSKDQQDLVTDLLCQNQRLDAELSARSNLTKDAEVALRNQASNGMRQYLEKAHEIRRLQDKQKADQQIIEGFKDDSARRRTLEERLAELYGNLHDDDQRALMQYIRLEARVADLVRQQRETVALIEQLNSSLAVARLSRDDATAGASTTPPSLASPGGAIEADGIVARRGEKRKPGGTEEDNAEEGPAKRAKLTVEDGEGQRAEHA